MFTNKKKEAEKDITKEMIKGRVAIQVCHGPGGVRCIIANDIIAWLYESNQPTLAKEITQRISKAFDFLEEQKEKHDLTINYLLDDKTKSNSTTTTINKSSLLS